MKYQLPDSGKQPGELVRGLVPGRKTQIILAFDFDIFNELAQGVSTDFMN
jgi:hypothetical protein